MIRDQHVSVVESNQPRNQQPLFTVPGNDNFSDEIVIADVSNFSASSAWLSLRSRRTPWIVRAHSGSTVLVWLGMAISQRCFVVILIRVEQGLKQMVIQRTPD